MANLSTDQDAPGPEAKRMEIQQNAIHSGLASSPNPMTTQPPDPSTSTSEADVPKTEDQLVETPSFGWNDYAERLNGRFAMIGFAALLITQLFTRQDFWSWIGL